MGNSIYWDIRNVLSYNALYNFIVGERGNGKSYGAKKFVISRFLQTGEQFAYVRRYKEEYKDSANTFFNDIMSNNEFEGCDYEVKGNKFLINGEVAGYGFILSTQSKKKSMSFPNISTIIYDEFLLDPMNKMDRYLNKEPVVFLNLYETIARSRAVRVFFLANAFTWQNPYFLYFNIEFPENKKKIRCVDDKLIQVTESLDYRAMKKETRFAKMISTTEFAQHSIDNEFVRDTKDFVIDQPKNLSYMFTMIANSEKFGVWKCETSQILYISSKHNPTHKLVYTTMENHEPNMLLFKGAFRSPLIKMLVNTFRMGGVYYDSVRTKNMVAKTLAGVI